MSMDRYWPSNDIILKVILRDLDPNFQGTKFEMLLSRKRWELVQSASYHFYRYWYSTSNDTIVNVVLRDLGLHFQGQTISSYAIAINILCVQQMSRNICLDSYGPRRGVGLVSTLFLRTSRRPGQLQAHSASSWPCFIFNYFPQAEILYCKL